MRGTPARAAAVVWVVLAAVYVASLAPDVTLWDAGEFNAAIATLGIPHPPGTPLYILIGRVWSTALGFLPQALAVNALSAIASATACALLARFVAKGTDFLSGVAAGVTAGLTFSLWQNATETEVYALSLLLAVGMVVAGDAAGRSGAVRHRVLLAYLVALAVPIQISALIAAPAAMYLAATPGRDIRPDAGRLLSLGAVFLLVTGVGLVSTWLLVLGVAVLLAIVAWRWERGPARWEPIALGAVAALGVSVTLFMLVRAMHDPGINQGDPSTWRAFVDVVARRQYDVPPLWPRRAPFWLQLGNVFQYADWQVALGLDDNVAGSWLRAPWTIIYGALAVYGARWHWRRDPRSARALLVLLIGATIGVVVVLNLRAGPSFGEGVLPPDAGHEPRERDYFFALGFATAAAWAGMGAVAILRRLAPRWASLGMMAAVLPAVFNWRAADRRRLPDAALPRALGTSLLESAPPRAVLLIAGDNDSYTTWYAQRVRHVRPDVTPITLPLLGADWYRRELARRDSLLSGTPLRGWTGELETIRGIRDAARRAGRPLATSIALDRDRRLALGGAWTLSGTTYVERDARGEGDTVDDAASDSIARLVDRLVPGLDRPSRDPTSGYVALLLSCPKLVREASRLPAAARDSLLDSRCNFK